MRLQRIVFDLAKCLQSFTALGAVGEGKMRPIGSALAILVEMT